jgi:hypothetical protein
MRKSVLAIVIIFFFSAQLLIGQNKESEKKVDVKIEKKIENVEGKEKITTKITLLNNGKVIDEEIGENVNLKDVLAKLNLTKDNINNISIKINSDIEQDDNEVWMNDDDEAMFYRYNNRIHKKHHNMYFMNENSLPMVMKKNDVSIYDFSKYDNETKEFNVKQKKNIDFKNIKIQPFGTGIKLSFAAEEKPLEVSIKDVKGKKVFYEINSDFKGIYQTMIPMINTKKGVYILEIKVGEKNWLQKIVVE